MTEVIKFYSTTGPYGCFSNFSRHSVKMNGKVWPTSEHYFQAMKFDDVSYREKIRKANSPSLAAKMGRNRSYPIKENWDSIRNKIMYDVCYQKFTQHTELKEILLSTKGCWLVEHTSNDNYWGDGGNGSGKNRLGKILMFVREVITNEQG